jgi:hypothetical protein
MINCNGKIVTDNLALCYDFSNTKCYSGSGSSMTNLGRNGSDGTLVGSPTFSAANGGILTLNGTSQYISLNIPASLVTGGAISIGMFVKWTTSAGIQTLIDNNHSATPQGFVVMDRGDLGGTPTSFYTVASLASTDTTVALGNGQWVYIMCTNDQVNSRIYINSVHNAVVARTGISTVQPTVTIGYWQGGSRYLNGSIGSVQIYNRALTQIEINQNYDVLKRRFGHS